MRNKLKNTRNSSQPKPAKAWQYREGNESVLRETGIVLQSLPPRRGAGPHGGPTGLWPGPGLPPRPVGDGEPRPGPSVRDLNGCPTHGPGEAQLETA